MACGAGAGPYGQRNRLAAQPSVRPRNLHRRSPPTCQAPAPSRMLVSRFVRTRQYRGRRAGWAAKPVASPVLSPTEPRSLCSMDRRTLLPSARRGPNQPRVLGGVAAGDVGAVFRRSIRPQGRCIPWLPTSICRPRADDLLVVGDEHADGHADSDPLAAGGRIVRGDVVGSRTSTDQPPWGPCPARSVPPARAARSDMPSRP